MTLKSDKISATCENLRNNHSFDCLSCLTGIDRGEQIEIVYHLFSYSKKETLVLKTSVPKNNAIVPTVSHIWPSANWMERETFDMVGVKFLGHPDLRQILLPEGFEGHPMLKDYKEKEECLGMSTTRNYEQIKDTGN